MAPPKRIDAFDHREFQVVLAQVGGEFRAVARDSRGQQIMEVSGPSLDDLKTKTKQKLNLISQDFVSINGAINLFMKAFPDGFKSELYVDLERNYKDITTKFLVDNLSEERIRQLSAKNDHAEVATLARQAVATSNLCFRNEQMALSNALRAKGVAQPFGEGLRELLYGDFDAALEELAHLLRPYNAAKWPILTFWPFFRFPDRHMFLKPTLVQDCAQRMGYELHYASTPNRDTYRSLLGFTRFVREGIMVLEPKDNIDVQSFMYVVATGGYVRDMIAEREAGKGAPLA